MKIAAVTLLLPLGLLLAGILLMAALVWQVRERGVEGLWRGAGLSLLLLALAGFGVAVSLPVTAAWLGGQIAARQAGVEELARAETMVVLTAGMLDAGPQLGWLPKAPSVQRMVAAYAWLRKSNPQMPVIISGRGTEREGAPSEAVVLADFFSGLHPVVVELEEASRDTYESARVVAPLLKERGIFRVALVTSDVHMLRALATYRAFGIDASPAPQVTLPARGGAKFYLPSAYGLALTSDVVYELYALVYYWASGKISLDDIMKERA